MTARSTANVQIAITQRISEALEDKYTPKSIACDISTVFDKMWQKDLLLKFSNYGFAGRVF